jgi:hypothetical protein
MGSRVKKFPDKCVGKGIRCEDERKNLRCEVVGDAWMRGCVEVEVGRWMLDVGCWMLDGGRWTLDGGGWTLVDRVSVIVGRDSCP